MADRQPSQQRPVQGGNPILAIFAAIFYIALIAISGSLSQLTLSPVYGSIPAAAQHNRVLLWGVLLGFFGKGSILPYLPEKPQGFLPLLAFYVPVAQWYGFRDSTRLGPTNGPIAMESLTFFPIVVLASICASNALDKVGSFRNVGAYQIAAGGLAYYALTYGEPLVTIFVSQLPAHSEWLSNLGNLGLPGELLTRVNLQLVTASSAVALAPSFWSMLAIPAVLHTTQYNPHFVSNYTTALVNASLYEHGWALLDRQESVTGYISVLENLRNQMRFLRCDHSLLGGEFLLTEQRRAAGSRSAEPIFAVFEILEAVRLVEATGINTSPDKSALVIGLGIGTAPKALLAHGVATTIVEIDPVVHSFARKYFDLPANHTPLITDAVSWASNTILQAQESSQPIQRYSYIIHDVFTGGAEPLDLFTDDFLYNLRDMLALDGVIAVNYAGDINETPTKQVLNTISQVFGGQCRIFRDTPPAPNTPADAPENNFTNMVVFCLHPSGPAATASSSDDTDAGTTNKRPIFTFRKPLEADFLGSISRSNYMVPKPELELQFPTHLDLEAETIKTVTRGNVGSFGKMQLESAKRHWAIMRKVVPAFVWENW